MRAWIDRTGVRFAPAWYVAPLALGSALVRMALCAGAALLPAWAAAADRPVVRACGHHDYPPWNWQQDARIVGVCADVARRAIERLGYRVDLGFVGPWKRCQEMVASGDVDVNICAFRNPERERYSVFSEPRMAQNRIAVFVPADKVSSLRAQPWQALAGSRTGLVLGVSMGPDFDAFLERETQVSRVSVVQQALRMLTLGRLDIVPFGWEAGLIEIERSGLVGRILPLESPALVGDLWLSVSKRSPLAGRIQEIGAYFARQEYAEELRTLLAEHHRRALQREAPGASAR